MFDNSVRLGCLSHCCWHGWVISRTREKQYEVEQTEREREHLIFRDLRTHSLIANSPVHILSLLHRPLEILEPVVNLMIKMNIRFGSSGETKDHVQRPFTEKIMQPFARKECKPWSQVRFAIILFTDIVLHYSTEMSTF